MRIKEEMEKWQYKRQRNLLLYVSPFILALTRLLFLTLHVPRDTPHVSRTIFSIAATNRWFSAGVPMLTRA